MKEQINLIKECKDFNAAAPLLAKLEREVLTAQHFTKLGRKLDQFTDEADIKIAYLTNFTVDLLPSYVNVFAATEKLKSNSYIAPYNQYFQEVLNEASGLSEFEPELILLALDLRLFEPEIMGTFSTLDEDTKHKAIENILKQFDQWLSIVLERFSSTILLANFPLPAYPQNGIADQNDPVGEMFFYMELNKGLVDLARQNPRIHIMDLAKLTSRFGTDNVYDPKMYYMAKMVWSERFLPIVAEEVLRSIIAIKGLTRKCLVLDLDNTLWGGVVGEEGPMGVKVGHGDPVSEAYYDFQNNVKAIKNRGIMLAICSKNNEQDVLEVFVKRADMPLQLGDFAATEINWDHKHTNLQRLAKGLNIGLDSLVFIDDNPVECELIRQMLPQVKTVQLPSYHEKIPGVINRMVDFEKTIILGDDLAKTEQYHQKRQREEFKENIGDINDYLQSLQTEICIQNAGKENFDRIHQLFTKTNQFNVTIIRYSMGDIERFYAEEKYEMKIVSARDKFGDLGIIGLYVLEDSANELNIDSFILSCRAMGRGIESAMMNNIKSAHLADENNVRLKARYSPTPKNIPVKDFFGKQGFTTIETKEDGETLYQLISSSSEPVECPWIGVNYE